MKLLTVPEGQTLNRIERPRDWAETRTVLMSVLDAAARDAFAQVDWAYLEHVELARDAAAVAASAGLAEREHALRELAETLHRRTTGR